MNRPLLRLAAALLALLMLFGLAACQSGSDNDVDIHAVTDEMRSAAEWPDMLEIRKGDSREQKGFAAISDMDYDKVDDFSLLYAADGSAYELAVIRLKDGSDVKELESSLKRHIDSRVSQYRYYDASQVPRAESAIVAVKGKYAALIMCGDPSAVKAVFDKNMQGY